MSWDTPHKEKPDDRLYHPRTLLWLAVDIPYITRNYIREKYNSLTATRWTLRLQIKQSMRSANRIATDESLPRGQRREAVRTLHNLKQMSEELDIEDTHIDMYIESYETLKHLL